MKKIFFNSSLPRAGSTLIQNILMHNPKIHSTPTSGLSELLLNARTLYSTGDAFRAQNEEEMEKAFKGFCNSALHGYFENITDRPYVIDKSRAWLGHYGFLDWFYEKPKIIVMVRDLRSIFSSMEKIFRKNQDFHQDIQNHSKMLGTTTAKRIDIWSNSPPVGLALERLNQIILEKINEKVLFIKAEDFTQNPKREIHKIYNYLNLPYFEHDFNNVEQTIKEDDSVYGLSNDLHTIRNSITPLNEDHEEILGIPICQ
jgi:sulfotransferase